MSENDYGPGGGTAAPGPALGSNGSATFPPAGHGGAAGGTLLVINGIAYTSDQWRQQVMLETLQRIEKLLQTLVARGGP